LGLSTPYATGAGQGLLSATGNYASGSFSAGIKFINHDTTKNGYLLYCDDSVIPKSMYWAIECAGDDLRFVTNSEGAQTMYGALEEDETYHLYFYVELTDVIYYLSDSTGNIISSGMLAITPIAPTTPRIIFLNSSAGDSPFIGTLYDFLFLDSPESFQDIYLAGGAYKALWALYFPMREGSGTTCTCVNTGEIMTAFSAFSWTTAPDDSFRWI
jgi:hypothetical protein